MSEDIPEDLRAALDAWQPGAARRSYRDSLREDFLEAGSTALGASPLSYQEAREVEGALAASPEPVASPEFRAGLKERFLSAAAANSPTTSEAPPAATTAPAAPRRRPRRARPQSAPRRSFAVPAFVGVAAAALLLFFLGPWSAAPAAAWAPVGYVPGSVYVLNGESVSYSDRDSLVQSFGDGGCQISVNQEPLSVVHLGEGLMLEFPGGTDFKIPPRAESESDLVEIELLSGGLMLSTTDEFQGRVLVHTPDMTIALTGQLLGVDVYPHGTCLCIVDGEAEMTSSEGSEARHISANSTTFVEREGGDSSKEGAYHAEDLTKFSTRRDQYLF